MASDFFDSQSSSLSTSDSQQVDSTSGKKATCPVCNATDICIITKTGTLRKHGHGGGRQPCAGSYGLPVASFSNTAVTADAYTNETQPKHKKLTHPQRHGPVLKWIPKGARATAANVLLTFLNDILKNPLEEKAWTKLFEFASVGLRKPQHGGKSRNLTSLVIKQLQSCAEDIQITEQANYHTHKVTRGINSDSAIAKRAASKLEEGNVCGAIRALCSNETIATPDETTIQRLKHLHPIMPADRRHVTWTQCNPLQATCKNVTDAIRSFPSGSAGGPDGLRPQHLKDLLSTVQDSALLETLTRFINLLLEGRVPTAVRPILFGASLTALNKKNGGIRPIAVGYTWRRLAAKICCSYVSEKAAVILTPRQLGFGTRCGAEAAAHAAGRYVRNLTEDKILFKIDFTNAFNTVRRDCMLEAVAEHFPELMAFASCSYNDSSALSFGSFSLESAEGPQQGDPLGPLYFCITVHKLLSSLTSEFVVGYLDDISFGDSTETAIKDFLQLETEASKLGLLLNRSKCEVVGASKESLQLLNEMNIVVTATKMSDATLLGVPLQRDKLSSMLSEKREELETMVKRLQLLPAHDALYLIRNVFAIPKLMYLLRTAPCFLCPELDQYDKVVRDSLSTLLNIALNDEHWSQASLPVWAGGLGIRSAVGLAPSAFLASAACSSAIIARLLPLHLQSWQDPHIPTALNLWQFRTGPIHTPPTGEQSFRQRSWDTPGCLAIAEQLVSQAKDETDKARLMAVCTPESGEWLNALPLSAAGLKLDDQATRIAVALRLGAFVVEEHTCFCGAKVSQNGIHGLHCAKSAGRQSRHGQVNDIICRALIKAGVAACREPLGLSPNDDRRPDGITVIPWTRGKCAIWDFTCPDTMAPSHVATTSVTVGAAATTAARTKLTKYSDLEHRYEVIPVAIETMGVCESQGRRFIDNIGTRLAEITHEPRSTAFLRQRIAIAIQRGNAVSVLGTHRSAKMHAE
jgi:hypothetical protein